MEGLLRDKGLHVADVSACAALVASAGVGYWDTSASCVGGAGVRLSLVRDQSILELALVLSGGEGVFYFALVRAFW